MLLKPRRARSLCNARITDAGSAGVLIRGEIRDVSATGLCLVTALPLKRGATLHLSFQLPTGLVEAVGEVRWRKKIVGHPNEFGVRFLRIPSTASLAIERAFGGERVEHV
jgi:hypothetical protein